MDNRQLAQKVNRKLIEADADWSNLDIWPRSGLEQPTVAHVFLSAVLSIIGDDEVKWASWSHRDGALVATVWTDDLVVQGARGSANDSLITTALPRCSLRAMQMHSSPLLSLDGWGVHVPKYTLELSYPDLDVVFASRIESNFLNAVANFKMDLAHCASSLG